MAIRKSKKPGDEVVDYIMKDIVSAKDVEEASINSIKNKSGAGIGEKPLHNQLKKKLQQTNSPLVEDKDKPIIDDELEREEQEFYDNQVFPEDTSKVERKPQQLNEQEKYNLKKGFKDALIHFGPRLASLLIGGAEALEGYESGMESFQAATQPDTSDMEYQQVEELRDEKGRPITFAKKTGKFYNIEGKETSVFTDPKMKQIKETQKTDLAKARSDFKTKIVKEFNSSVQESQKAIGMAKSAISLIDSDSKLAMPVAARAIARLAGEGTRMTDKDVEQFMGSQAVSDSLKRVYQRAVDGTMTDEDKKVMKDAINRMQEVEMGLLTKTRDDMATRYGAVDENLATKDEIMSLLAIQEDKESKKEAPKIESNQKIMKHPTTGKRYVVDKLTNQVIGEYK